jgi:hypothetical protein
MVLVSNGTDIVNGLNYIADFGTNSFSVTNLTASSATITNLIATSGSITNFVSSDASATVLRAGSATLTHLSATSASITNLTLTSLVISNLSIASANITTLTGSTQTLSGNLTLNGGTANGVLYLNGSKVATSGTALVFDGAGVLTVGSDSVATVFNAPGDVVQYVVDSNGAGATASHQWRYGSTEAMRLTSTGLGIGTSSPAVKLQVKSSAEAFRIEGTTARGSGNIFATFHDPTGRKGYWGYGDSADNYYISNELNTPMLFLTNAVERMRLDSSGQLALGTTTATNTLTVQGTVAYNLNSTTDVYKYFTGGAGLVYAGTTTSTAIGFLTSGGERMRLDTSGNFGIGTSSPTVPLDVQSNSGGTGIIIRGRATANTGTLRFYANNGTTQQAKFEANDSTVEVGSITNVPLVLYTNGSERARITSGGDLLVGTTNTSATAGEGFKSVFPIAAVPSVRSVGNNSTSSYSTYEVYSTSAAAYRFYVDYAGTVFATTTTISAISDQRFKENVQDIDVGLNAVMALKPRKFDWKAGKGKDIKGDRGFIAQEFEQVFPDLIDEWKDPAPEGEEPYKSVRQDLIPVLVKAIQELTARVAQLESK